MKNNQKGFVSLVLIGVLFLVIVGGYFILKANKQPITQQAQVTPATEIANWKTYSYSQYGFAIQLPSDWQVQPDKLNNAQSGIFLLDSAENAKVVEEGKKRQNSEGSASNITILYYDDIVKQAASENVKLNSKTLEEYVSLTGKNDPSFSVKKVSFAGEPAFRGKADGLYDTDIILIEKDNHLYKIWLQSNTGMDAQLSAKILSTFKVTQPTKTAATSACKADENIPPVIISLSSYTASIGDKITIHGCNLNGFEGDKNVWIENNDKVKGILYGVRDTDNENLQVTLTSPVCEKDISYSGSPCDKWITLTPGIYKMYVMPWSKKSNEVSITIK